MFFIRAFAVFFDRVQEGKARLRWIDSETAGPTRYIFNFIVCAFALAIAFPYLPGANTEAFKGISVLLGVMVSIGGASVIGQAFSGLILMYTKAFRRGEYVRIGDTEGTVTDLGMFATRSAVEFELRPEGEAVLIPVRGARPAKSRFAKLRGTATVKMSTREIMALTRG